MITSYLCYEVLHHIYSIWKLNDKQIGQVKISMVMMKYGIDESYLNVVSRNAGRETLEMTLQVEAHSQSHLPPAETDITLLNSSISTSFMFAAKKKKLIL